MSDASVTDSEETAAPAAEEVPEALAPVLQRLLDRFGDAVLATHSELGDHTALVEADRLVEVCEFCRDDPELSFCYLMDLAGVDYLEFDDGPRFGVVYHLYSLAHNSRVRLKVRVDEGLSVPSLTGVWKAANWFEREVYDMFGVSFAGHSNLTRILMYDGFEGHPLRKDYPYNKRQPRLGPRN